MEVRKGGRSDSHSNFQGMYSYICRCTHSPTYALRIRIHIYYRNICISHKKFLELVLENLATILVRSSLSHSRTHTHASWGSTRLYYVLCTIYTYSIYRPSSSMYIK